LLNIPLAAVGIVLALALARELFVPRPLPAPPAARAPLAPPSLGAVAVPESGTASDLGAYNMISARNLFNPARSETTTVATARPAGKPVLHGVVLDGARSRAYVEDPLVKGVFGYTVGDSVGRGQITTISADRIMIAGPEGTFEVLLHDPSKPKPAPPPAGTATAPRPPAAPVPPAVRRTAPGAVPGQPPAPASQPSDN
jgi:hypothetical protein